MNRIIKRLFERWFIPLEEVRKFVYDNCNSTQYNEEAEVNGESEWDKGYDACLYSISADFLGEDIEQIEKKVSAKQERVNKND